MSYNFTPEQKKSYYISRMNDSRLTGGQRKYARDYVQNDDDGRHNCDGCKRPTDRIYPADFDNRKKFCGPCSKRRRFY